MKYAITTIAIIILSASSPAPVRADTGGCYSLQPLCSGSGRPVCICGPLKMNCAWVCSE